MLAIQLGAAPLLAGSAPSTTVRADQGTAETAVAAASAAFEDAGAVVDEDVPEAREIGGVPWHGFEHVIAAPFFQCAVELVPAAFSTEEDENGGFAGETAPVASAWYVAHEGAGSSSTRIDDGATEIRASVTLVDAASAAELAKLVALIDSAELRDCIADQVEDMQSRFEETLASLPPDSSNSLNPRDIDIELVELRGGDGRLSFAYTVTGALAETTHESTWAVAVAVVDRAFAFVVVITGDREGDAGLRDSALDSMVDVLERDLTD